MKFLRLVVVSAHDSSRKGAMRHVLPLNRSTRRLHFRRALPSPLAISVARRAAASLRLVHVCEPALQIETNEESEIEPSCGHHSPPRSPAVKAATPIARWCFYTTDFKRDCEPLEIRCEGDPDDLAAGRTAHLSRGVCE